MCRKFLEVGLNVCQKSLKKYFSAIGQYLVNNQKCARKFKKDKFSILAQAENPFQLPILEALNIQILQPNLCKQKKFVYKSRIYRSLS